PALAPRILLWQLPRPADTQTTARVAARRGRPARWLPSLARPHRTAFAAGPVGLNARLQSAASPVRHAHHCTPLRPVASHFAHASGEALPPWSAPVFLSTAVAQFITVCRRSKWSIHRTKSPFLALLAIVGSKAAY